MGQALLVAQLDPAEVEHGVLHGDLDALPAARLLALQKRRQDAGHEVDAGTRVADLGAGHGRRAVLEAGGGRRAAGALGDVLVDLEVLVGAGPEALDRGIDQARVELLNMRPGKAHAVERAGREILHHDVADIDQLAEDLLALLGLGIEGEAALVAVQHREVEAVHVGQVAQLAARDVAAPRQLDLDHVGPEPAQDLRARGARLDMGHVQNADPLQSPRHSSLSPARLRYLYMVWALVPGAYWSGSTQMLTTAERPSRSTASRARRSAGPTSPGARTSSP